jgi:hypothetical protein
MWKRNSSRTFCFLTIFAFIAGVAGGCAKSSETSDPCPNGPVSTCPCADGQTGSQQCSNGIYSACQCGTAGSGVSGTTGSGAVGTAGSAAGGTAGATSRAIGTGGGISSTGSGGTAAGAGATASGAAGFSLGIGGLNLGGAGTITVPSMGGKCPDGFTCSSNALLNMFIQNVKFCAENATTTDPANAIPPACVDTAECKSKGLSSGACTDFSTPSGGLSDLVGLKKNCLAMCQQ